MHRVKEYFENQKLLGVPAVAQWAEDVVLSLQQLGSLLKLGFDPEPSTVMEDLVLVQLGFDPYQDIQHLISRSSRREKIDPMSQLEVHQECLAIFNHHNEFLKVTKICMEPKASRNIFSGKLTRLQR